MINSQPKVSVLMPVYNGELYIREAIDSILNQTFSDFELIIIDDCSTDGSVAVIKTYTDSRIRLFTNPVNKGVSFTTNYGNKLARAEYVARMDCDDISLPQRLAKQVQYLDRHPEIAIVGTQNISIDTDGKIVPAQDMFPRPAAPSSIRWTASYECPFIHSSVMYRKQILPGKVGEYDENLKMGEDYEMWLRLLHHNYNLANLKEVLIEYRIHPKSAMNSISIFTRIKSVDSIKKHYLDALIPDFKREKEIIIDFFATYNPSLAMAANLAMDTLLERYISIYLHGKITKDLSTNVARKRAGLAYALFLKEDRWQAINILRKAIWQYPGLVSELPVTKFIYLILFGASGRDLFRSLSAKFRSRSK